MRRNGPHAPPLRGSLPPKGVGLAGGGPARRPAGHEAALLRGSRPVRGFTLIELLVAITIMSLLALLSWRSIDGMTRTQTLTQQRADELMRMQAALGQWGADLDALVNTGEVNALEFDGRVLRLTRRDSSEAGLDSAGIRVVAWTRRQGSLPTDAEGAGIPAATGYWVRWQSPPVVQRDELARAWQRAADWSREAAPITQDNAGVDSAIALVGIDQWQLFYHRGETWGNPLSSVGTESTGGVATTVDSLPNGVRLILTLSAGQGLSGDLVRDWVRPTLQAGRP